MTATATTQTAPTFRPNTHGPIGTFTGAPVTEKAERIAEALKGQQAYAVELARLGDWDTWERATALLARMRHNYDYYNWTA